MIYDTLIILGSNGMLGQYIRKYFEKNTTMKIVPIDRSIFNVLNDDITKLGIILKEYLCNTSVLINCIGIIPQSSKDQILSENNYIRVNQTFPHELSKLCEFYGCKMVHSTTDCVYLGSIGKYNETSNHDSTDIYGKSKSAGEPDNCSVIRTSIIGEEVYHSRSLVEWLKSNNCGNINGYTNHYWNGITCLEYAKVLHKMIFNNIFWQGVRHIFSPDTVSKYELLELINKEYKLNIDINKFETETCIDRSISTIYNENSLFKIPPLKQQITEMRNFANILYDYIIPKVLYLYWDGNVLSYLQYLTVITFKKYNPDWKIVLYMPTKRYEPQTWTTSENKIRHVGEDWLPRLLLLDITVRKMDFEKIGFKNEIPEVFKSDYIRYWLLGNYGGMWADFDIIFISPMSTLFDKNVYDMNFQIYGNVDKIDTVVCYCENTYPIGLLLSKPDNSFYLELSRNASTSLDLKGYQSIGCLMIKKLFGEPHMIYKKHESLNILNISANTYLPYQWNQIDNIFKNNVPQNIKKYTIGIHWFNGSRDTSTYKIMIDYKILPETGSLYKYIKEYVEK